MRSFRTAGGKDLIGPVPGSDSRLQGIHGPEISIRSGDGKYGCLQNGPVQGSIEKYPDACGHSHPHRKKWLLLRRSEGYQARQGSLPEPAHRQMSEIPPFYPNGSGNPSTFARGIGSGPEAESGSSGLTLVHLIHVFAVVILEYAVGPPVQFILLRIL